MPNFYPALHYSQEHLRGKLLIVPSVSLANLPQLAVDLIITSLNLERIGWIGDGSTVIPFVGQGDRGEIVSGGLEVYGSSSSDIVVIQQRSPTLKSKKEEHLNLLHTFITTNSFAFTLILTSLDAASQDDAQLLTPHQHIIPPNTPPSPHIDIIKTHTSPLQLHLEPLSPGQASAVAHYPPFLPSAGLTRKLLLKLQNADPLPPSHAAIGAWCVEGDNRGDARALAELSLVVLGNEGSGIELREPKSWEGLFGVTQGWGGGVGLDSELYG